MRDRWVDMTGHNRADFMFDIDFFDTIGSENERGGWTKKDHPVGGTPEPTRPVGSRGQ